jgi:hypothetical protein
MALSLASEYLNTSSLTASLSNSLSDSENIPSCIRFDRVTSRAARRATCRTGHWLTGAVGVRYGR